MPPDWQPTTADVAKLVVAYTREQVTGGYASLEPAAGRERGEFTDNTSPSLAQVVAFIDSAVEEITGRVGLPGLPLTVYALAHSAAVYHAAASVEAARRPRAIDDASGLYEALLSNYRASLGELIAQARRTDLEIP